MHRLTLDALVSGFTPRTDFISLPSLVFIARSAHREATFIAGNEELAVNSDLHAVPTYLTNLRTEFLHRLDLEKEKKKNKKSMIGKQRHIMINRIKYTGRKCESNRNF